MNQDDGDEERGARDFQLKLWSLKRISTGSEGFDSLLGGGLPVSSVTDVFGAAATGKTQFAFQNALMTGADAIERNESKIAVVFVDCAGSFRPERIAEIAEARGFSAERILQVISSIYVRSIAEQTRASELIFSEEEFRKCRLIIVDDVTTNFVSELSKEEELVQRQYVLSVYARQLSYIANRRGLCVLLTNSVRSRGELGEGETTGDILSQYSLFRLYFKRKDRDRFAFVEQPSLRNNSTKFEIETSGIR